MAIYWHGSCKTNGMTIGFSRLVSFAILAGVVISWALASVL